MNKAGNPDNVTTNTSSSFKYKWNIFKKLDAVGENEVSKNAKIAVSLNYVSNF